MFEDTVTNGDRSKWKMFAAAVGLGVAAGTMVRRLRLADLGGQVVLITGGSRGLGLALAQEFARLGCRIAICARHVDQLDRARVLLANSGADVFAYPCDVTDRDAVHEMIQAVRQHFGRIDILVNNAGIISVAPIQNTTFADFESAMDVMFWGVVNPTLTVLPEMLERGSGRIANITSIGGKVSVPHLVPYCCAKFAAVAFSEGLRAEVAGQGIQVTTIAPGLMRTGSYLNAKFKGNKADESLWFSIASTNPLMAMNAARAARQIVSAIRRGASEKILTTQATVLARIHGALPGVIPSVLALVNRLLPSPAADGGQVLTGAELNAGRGGLFQAATTLGRRAAECLNEVPSAGVTS